MNYNKSGSLYIFFLISYFLKAYSMVVHMALELSLETKVRPAAPSGVVCPSRFPAPPTLSNPRRGSLIPDQGRSRPFTHGVWSGSALVP